MQKAILKQTNFNHLNQKNITLFILFFSMTMLGFSQTSGGGIFQPLVDFLNNIYTGLMVVVGIGAVVILVMSIFKHLSDPNLGQLFIVIIGTVMVVVLVYKAKDMISMVGGSTLDIDVIKSLYFK